MFQHYEIFVALKRVDWFMRERWRRRQRRQHERWAVRRLLHEHLRRVRHPLWCKPRCCWWRWNWRRCSQRWWYHRWQHAVVIHQQVRSSTKIVVGPLHLVEVATKHRRVFALHVWKRMRYESKGTCFYNQNADPGAVAAMLGVKNAKIILYLWNVLS